MTENRLEGETGQKRAPHIVKNPTPNTVCHTQVCHTVITQLIIHVVISGNVYHILAHSDPISHKDWGFHQWVESKPVLGLRRWPLSLSCMKSDPADQSLLRMRSGFGQRPRGQWASVHFNNDHPVILSLPAAKREYTIAPYERTARSELYRV